MRPLPTGWQLLTHWHRFVGTGVQNPRCRLVGVPSRSRVLFKPNSMPFAFPAPLEETQMNNSLVPAIVPTGAETAVPP